MWPESWGAVEWISLVFILVAGLGIPLLTRLFPSDRRSIDRLCRRHGVSFLTVTVFWFLAFVLASFPTGQFIEPSRSGGMFTHLVMVSGMLLLAYAVGNLPTYLRLLLTTTTDVADIQPGRVGVVGTVVADESITAPLTATDVVAYQLSVRSRVDLTVREGWKQDLFTDERVPFQLQDRTGQIRVDPTGADIRFSYDDRLYGKSIVGERANDRVVSFVTSETAIDPDDTEFKYAENRLEPGTEIYVSGTATRDEATGEFVVGDGSTFLIKPGTETSVRATFRWIVFGGGSIGIGLVCIGLLMRYWPLWYGYVSGV